MTWLDDAAPTVTVPSSPIIAEATSSAGASVDFAGLISASDSAGGSLTPTCVPASGTTFNLGESTVSCTATDGGGQTNDPPATFTIKVVDTTSPAIGPMPIVSPTEATAPGATPVSYPLPPANDLVDGGVTPACSPASSSGFPVGTSTVTCTATDRGGNSASGSFTVTVKDTTPPSLGAAPPDQTIEATSPSGAVATYAAPAATDNGDASPAVNCTPASGSTFPFDTTAVSCTARDSSGNSSSPASFSITVRDTTAPQLNLPANIQVEADSTAGKAVTYAVSATDLGGSVAASCSPASGSTFPAGTTTVTCSATDAKGNTANGSFTVTVTDSSGPSFTGVSSNRQVEANGPSGSVVNFSTPTATDTLDGPIATVNCLPASGSTFPLGTTAVTCSASDSRGNASSATFNVTVQDTTPPNLIVPAARSVYATTPTGIPNTVSGIVSFLSAPSATDIVDPSPAITNNAPAFLPIGNLTITFAARDWSGNGTSKDVTLIVLPQPPAGTPPLVVPPPPAIPAQPTNVRVTPLDGAARIQWNAGGREVMVTRSSSSARSLSALGDERVVYTGKGSSYVDRGLTNGVEYRYVVIAVDAAGNHSAGVAAVIVPRRNLLKSPKDGARLRKAPRLLWAADPEAQYYNAQLLLNGKKILSAWPTRAAYVLKKSWKFEGRTYTLKPGVYTWFVWPGYGARSAVDYGELLGSRTFRIVR